MCGIAGVFGAAAPGETRAMLERLIHRGPDDGFMVSGDRFSLGARRLSIVDLEAGRQPLPNETKDVWAAQNGEIYNYPLLRKEVLAAGHHLSSHCDTEIHPHLYEDFGDDFPAKIDGMFAVGVWDEKRQRGLLARDRMGKKPLYYLFHDEAVYFASEIKALLTLPFVDRRINFEALHHYLSLKHVPHPHTIFEGIFSLPPAHMMTFENGRGVIRRYWDLSFAGNDHVTEDQAVDHIVDLLRRGVEKRLMSDVPIGFFLSGGIDSSLSTALAAEASPGRIKTFTLTYGDDSTTEGKNQDRRWARWVAEKYGTEHHEEVVDFSSLPTSLRDILKCFDEPFAGTTSTFLLSKLISRHVKVAVAGDGADELFGSYLSHRLAFPISRLDEFLRTGDESLIRPFEKQPEYLQSLVGVDEAAWRGKLLVYSEQDKRSLYSPATADRLKSIDTVELLRADFAKLTAHDPLNRILELEFRTFLPDQVLAFVDRLSMAHSLEVRSAFLDTDLVTFVASLPGAMKMKNGETKHLLKRAASRFFPDEMVYRRKEGFLMPITDWILRDLQQYVRATLSSERLAIHGIFDSAAVHQLVEKLYAHQNPTYRDVNQVFALLVFQEWYELYML